MLFLEGLKHLHDRKYLARAAWKEAGKDKVRSLAIIPGFSSIMMFNPEPTPNVGNWLPLIADFEADDWELV